MVLYAELVSFFPSLLFLCVFLNGQLWIEHLNIGKAPGMFGISKAFGDFGKFLVFLIDFQNF